MSAHLICVTAGGGLPIFARKKGHSDSLPFSIVGSLNGVHMFARPFNIALLNTITDDYSVAWKDFEESLVIIGIASGCSVDVLNKLLESVFNAIVLIVGIDEVKTQRNAERLKRELRICYPVIDRLLDSLDCGDSSNKHSSDVAGFVETILCPENHLMQIVLDSFTECVDSMYSCLLIAGKIAAATESWWSLTPDEMNLLSLLATSENTANSKDIPVFLPHKSPTVAFRFVACTLIPEVQLCCLCGPTPILNDIEHSVTQCFRNSTDILNAAVQCSPKNFPSSYNIDGGVLGVLLVNSATGKYMISKSPQQNSKKAASSSHRLDILRSFFYRAVMNTLIPSYHHNLRNDGSKSDGSTPTSSKDKLNVDDGISSTETYWCSEYHKCHALKVNDNILCILYSSSVPNHAMRLITQKMLKQFTSDKQVCW